MKKLFNKSNGEDYNFWMSYTDLMSGFLIVFIIASLVAYNGKDTYNTKTHKVIPIGLEAYDPKTQKKVSIGLETYDPKKKFVLPDSIGVGPDTGTPEGIIVLFEQYKKIQEILTSIKNINRNYFKYDETFKRYTLRNIPVSFKTQSSNINDISSSQRARLLEAGRSIIKFVDAAVNQNPDVKYMLIVEGQASNDGYKNNYELSYARALSLVKYWVRNGILFDSNCEIIISGSGQASSFRDQPDNATNKLNQRFVIHIIPKIGELK